MERTLTDTDKANLGSYSEKCAQLNAYTLACIQGLQTGLLLFGSGGNGKSFSIRQTLQERNIRPIDIDELKPDDPDLEDDEQPPENTNVGQDSYCEHLGRITPKGLVKSMAQFPKSIHLIEDAETMFDDKNCWGVLRSALHSQEKGRYTKRYVPWETSSAKGSFNFHFTGSLIIVGNRRLDKNKEEIEAVKTRCPCVEFNITNAELIAKMKQICDKGNHDIEQYPLTPNDCYDALEFILKEWETNPKLSRDAMGQEKKLNIRLLMSGFSWLRMSRIERGVDWKHQLRGQMEQQITCKRGRAARVFDEKQIAADHAEKRWKSEHDKLVSFCKAIMADVSWIDLPRDSVEYKRGFAAAKKNFSRKQK